MRNMREFEAALLKELALSNLITIEQRTELIRENTVTKKSILEIVQEKKLVLQDFLLEFMAKVFDAKMVKDKKDLEITTTLFTDELYLNYNILVRVDDEDAKVYFASPIFSATWDEIGEKLQRPYEKFLVGFDLFEEVAQELKSGIQMRKNFALINNEEVKKLPESQRAIRFVDALLDKCIKLKASDIHVEPQKDHFRIRMRINGVLQTIGVYDKDFYPLCSSRVKLLSNLNIAEKRVTQDGAVVYKYTTASDEVIEVPFRVSIMPIIYGEKIVLRKLGGQDIEIKLSSLGMDEALLLQWKKVITKPHGIVLVSGPTGSGKSTTLQAAITEINSDEINITTVEDPVEAKIEGVNQVQIDSYKVSFADALRSILRQDPDVIMIGEVRDKETAEIALRASLTGHLVYSTIHTNDAPSSVTRLVDMGIEPFLVSSSVVAVLAQRLVRVLCPNCKKERMTNEVENKLLGLKESVKIFDAVGCVKCNNSGYVSRTGVHELMVVDPVIARMINDGKSDIDIKEYAVDTLKMETIFSQAKKKVLSGITTIDELKKIVAE